LTSIGGAVAFCSKVFTYETREIKEQRREAKVRTKQNKEED
jgi:hypothetical protein